MTDLDDEATEILVRSLRALEPWSDRIVLIGGWAMQPPITFFQASERGDQSLAPVHLEFHAPIRGRQTHETIEIAPGVGAQALRYLDLSFGQVRSVDGASVPFLGTRSSASIHVPSPAAYLLAKALTLGRRKPAKRSKDYAYIYVLARITRPSWDQLRTDLENLDVHPKWRRKAHDKLRTAFESQRSEGVVEAVRSLDDVRHSADVVHGVVGRFLRHLGVVGRG